MLHSEDLMKVTWRCVHYAMPDDIDNVLAQLNSSTLKVIHSDLSGVKNDFELFSLVAEVLEFPSYFGNNWDALNDMLFDMEWMSAKGYVLVFSHSRQIWCESTHTAGKFVSAWLTAAELWGLEGIPFHLVFVVE